MDLSELAPKWFIKGNDPKIAGLTFLCPHCRAVRLAVMLDRWTLVGDSFESLTISPSVDASAAGHWHGFIQAGKIV
jgi:hypothetical protein